MSSNAQISVDPIRRKSRIYDALLCGAYICLDIHRILAQGHERELGKDRSFLWISSNLLGRKQCGNGNYADASAQHGYIHIDNLSHPCGRRPDRYARFLCFCLQRASSPCPVVRYRRGLRGVGAAQRLALTERFRSIKSSQSERKNTQP